MILSVSSNQMVLKYQNFPRGQDEATSYYLSAGKMYDSNVPK